MVEYRRAGSLKPTLSTMCNSPTTTDSRTFGNQHGKPWPTSCEIMKRSSSLPSLRWSRSWLLFTHLKIVFQVFLVKLLNVDTLHHRVTHASKHLLHGRRRWKIWIRPETWGPRAKVHVFNSDGVSQTTFVFWVFLFGSIPTCKGRSWRFLPCLSLVIPRDWWESFLWRFAFLLRYEGGFFEIWPAVLSVSQSR